MLANEFIHGWCGATGLQNTMCFILTKLTGTADSPEGVSMNTMTPSPTDLQIVRM